MNAHFQGKSERTVHNTTTTTHLALYKGINT